MPFGFESSTALGGHMGDAPLPRELGPRERGLGMHVIVSKRRRGLCHQRGPGDCSHITMQMKQKKACNISLSEG